MPPRLGVGRTWAAMLLLAGCGAGTGAPPSRPDAQGGAMDAGADATIDVAREAAGTLGGVRDVDGGGPLYRLPTFSACTTPATAPTRVRVVSWNVAIGRVTSIQRVAEELMRMDPDVVLVQELDVGTNRSGNTDQAQVLSAALGMPYTYAATLPFDSGYFGMGLFSRLPFQDVQVRWLDRTGSSEPRIGLSAWLCVGTKTLRAISFHAEHIGREAPARNATELVQWVTADLGTGTLLAGDFNAEASEPGPQAALAGGLVDVLASRDPRPTLNERRIDFVFVDAQLAAGVVGARVESSTASDHLPLLVDLTIMP